MEQDQSLFELFDDDRGDTFDSCLFPLHPANVDHRPFEYGAPWNPYHRDSTERDYTMGRVGEVFSETASGSSSSSQNSSPKLYDQVDAEHLPHAGLGFRALSRLNEPALIQHQQHIAPNRAMQSIQTESECQRTESDYPVTSSLLSNDGSGYARVRRPHSPRQQSRWEPYHRNKRYPSPTNTSKGEYYVHSDFDVSSIVSPNDVETQSTYSYADYLNTGTNDYHYKTSEFESGSINPQLTMDTISVTEQQYCPSLSSMQVGTGDSGPTIAPKYSPQILDEGSYSTSSDDNELDMPMSDSSDEELEGNLRRDSKKGALAKNSLKRKSSKKDKKRSPRVCSNGVQKTGEVKGDKSIRGKKAKERYMCKHHCPQVFTNPSELRKHMQVKHERPFKCTFSFAGCNQSFGSKNEWKRHVTSQHMNLSYWECSLSSCKDRQAFFNRKDLFGQHVKRMHVPQGKRIENYMSDAQKKDIQEKNREERDRWIRQEVPKIQGLCHKVLKEPPLESNCEICRSPFSGPKSWDAKMEHVGKHYESGENPLPGGPFEDVGLIKWALLHNLVEERIPYEDSSPNTSDGEYDEKEDPFSGISSSAHKIIMEDRRKYRFTKVNHFGPKIEGISGKPAEKLARPTCVEDLDPRFEDYSSGEFLIVSDFFDGAYEGPCDHDTQLLLIGPRVI